MNGSPISGAANSATYTTPATATSQSGEQFTVVVSNGAGTVTSAAATLTVNLAPVAPTITTQPANQTVTARPEEHTSELPSHLNPLCRHLLVKNTPISCPAHS